MNSVVSETLNSVNSNTPSVAVCPMHKVNVSAEVELLFPMAKRTICRYVTDHNGARELIIYCGDKEISFDEPELFSFGKNLTKQSRFIAKEALKWQEGVEWSRIKALLEQLIIEGILEIAEQSSVHSGNHFGARESLLPPAQCTKARTWFESAEITEELTGRLLDLGYLEMVIPIFRVAHMALDAEGRQVGEANVFPKPLRLDIPTDWRVCPHTGSRYMADLPMNVTALKSMRSYWDQIMLALLQIRATFLDRFPTARQGWTVGDLERLSSLVLALPAYLLMRKHNRVENGDLHPALSSMFRVTDGVRMTMHQMLFIAEFEPTLPPDATMDSQEIYAYADRNYVFFSEQGVCAGSKSMIEDFLHHLVDGYPLANAESVHMDEPVKAALSNLDSAFEYGLHGLQVHAVIFSLWPAMARAYEQLWQIVEPWAGNQSETFQELRTFLQQNYDQLKTTRLASETARKSREQVYADMYEKSAEVCLDAKHCQLAELIAPVFTPQNQRAEQQLNTILAERLQIPAHSSDSVFDDFITCLMNYLRIEQAIVSAGCEIQTHINQLLGREQPTRAFMAADIDIYHLFHNQSDRLPYLVGALAQLFELSIVITKDAIEIYRL